MVGLTHSSQAVQCRGESTLLHMTLIGTLVHVLPAPDGIPVRGNGNVVGSRSPMMLPQPLSAAVSTAPAQKRTTFDPLIDGFVQS